MENDGPLVRITVKPTGPLVLQGPVVILDTEGNEIIPPPAKTPGVIKLCRCGHSRNKPFCDSSHKTASWDPGPGPGGAAAGSTT